MKSFSIIIGGLLAAACFLRAIHLGCQIREERQFEYRHRFQTLPRKTKRLDKRKKP